MGCPINRERPVPKVTLEQYHGLRFTGKDAGCNHKSVAMWPTTHLIDLDLSYAS
jgi:hypothetical protein